MLEFIAALPGFDENPAVQTVWARLKESLGDVEGLAYYKHPVIGRPGSSPPDLTVLARGYHPFAIRCLNVALDEIESVSRDAWTINGETVESPIQELDDLIVGLEHRFKAERAIRRRFDPGAVLALPQITKAAYEAKYGELPEEVQVVWANLELGTVLRPIEGELTDFEWSLAESVFQAASPLARITPTPFTQATTLGPAIREMEKRIALLDREQSKVAVQIPPGPQRIRGMAGTGKTVLLAMKAANIHLRDPDARILFTFHTRSLYNQARSFITRFYRFYSDEDPDWEKLHIRHSWGSRYTPGVYSEIVRRQGATPLIFTEAKNMDAIPFRACCRDALSREIEPAYDYVLIDEAQDFPSEFFQIAFKLAEPPHRIYWAYDSLQDLTDVDIPRPEELFGRGEDGAPLVTVEGTHAGDIERDLVLKKSYRCPLPILMLAHGLGLGIYREKGPVQMLPDVASWEAVGYRVAGGTLSAGQKARIERPFENSPTVLHQIYTGQQRPVLAKKFDARDDEITWVAEQIAKDIREEGVRPEQIIVIPLNPLTARKRATALQARLFKLGIESLIPGFQDDASEYAEAGRVTLSTVYRAKGNEAAVVYVVGIDELYDYSEEIVMRNMAFTSISRSKGWVRITGIGKGMQRAMKEIEAIQATSPAFEFVFPDPATIKNLEMQVSQRRREKETLNDAVKAIMSVDPEAVRSLSLDSAGKQRLKDVLKELSYEDQ